MKQSIVVALFLLLQGAGIGHVSANPYPSTYEASAHSPYVLVSQAIDAGEGEGWFSGWVRVENNRITAVNTMDVPLPEASRSGMLVSNCDAWDHRCAQSFGRLPSAFLSRPQRWQ